MLFSSSCSHTNGIKCGEYGMVADIHACRALKEQLHAEDMSKKGMKERKKVRKIQAKVQRHR